MDQYQLEGLKTTHKVFKWITLLGILLLGIIVLGMIGCPKYMVYQQQLKGEAELKRAEQNRKITIQEAQAKEQSAQSLANADVTRAKGVAQSNEIIGASLKDNEAYLHWLWIDNIEKNPQAVIYVPTEANLPILEAGRLSK